MKRKLPLYLFVLVLQLLHHRSLAERTCIACTSDNGGNPECEEHPETVAPTVCNPEFGDEYCYVMLTIDKTAGDSHKWNRGCCTPKVGVTVCDPEQPGYINTDYYTLWKARCNDKDDCNTMDPRVDNGG